MDNVITTYNEGKLLVRAMDFPQLQHGIEGLEYNCTEWANEFCLLLDGKLTSASSTLIIPGVGVSTYKSIGFLINSDLADCYHICKSDSGSSGNVATGNFFANTPDFETIDELANYIITSRDNKMNEVNINTSIESVLGLFINECPKQDQLLKMIYLARRCLKDITGIEYPIYSYDLRNGKLNYVELTNDLEEHIIQNLRSTKLMYWPDNYEEAVTEEIKNRNAHLL